MKNPFLFFIVLLFIILNVIDCITAFFILPGEANPLFLLTNSIVPLIVVKIILSIIVIYIYNRNIFPSNFMLYTLILIMVYSIFIFIVGISSNIYGILNPIVIENASKLSVSEKTNSYYIFISLLYILPTLLSLISFWLYEKILLKTKIEKIYKRT